MAFWNARFFIPAVVSIGAVGKTLLENSWIFTSMPMAGDSESNPAKKFFYGVGLVVASVMIFGGLSYQLENRDTRKSNEVPLLEGEDRESAYSPPSL
jgi:hypothetical protein